MILDRARRMLGARLERSPMDESNSQLEEMRRLLRADRERAERRRLQNGLTPVDSRSVRRRRFRRLLRELRLKGVKTLWGAKTLFTARDHSDLQTETSADPADG
jgi:hypothetical protein